MKVSVASTKNKVLYTIATILIWIPTVYLFATIPTKWLIEGEAIMATILLLATDVFMTVYACITLFSNVVIDEKGITLRRGIIEVNHIAWEQVRRIEMFEALYARSLIWHDKYLRIMTTEEESYAFKYRRPPLNCEQESICFIYDSQAHDIIKKYYTGDICR